MTSPGLQACGRDLMEVVSAGPHGPPCSDLRTPPAARGLGLYLQGGRHTAGLCPYFLEQNLEAEAVLCVSLSQVVFRIDKLICSWPNNVENSGNQAHFLLQLQAWLLLSERVLEIRDFVSLGFAS